MGWLKRLFAEMEQEESSGGGNDASNMAHPIKELLEFFKGTDLSNVAYKAEQKDDGTKVMTFTLPSRSQLEKMKAMEVAEQQMQQQKSMPAQNVSQMPAGGSAGMGGGEMAAAAKSNVKVRVAMTDDDVIKQFPKVFVKAMGF